MTLGELAQIATFSIDKALDAYVDKTDPDYSDYCDDCWQIYFTSPIHKYQVLSGDVFCKKEAEMFLEFMKSLKNT